MPTATRTTRTAQTTRRTKPVGDASGTTVNSRTARAAARAKADGLKADIAADTAKAEAIKAQAKAKAKAEATADATPNTAVKATPKAKTFDYAFVLDHKGTFRVHAPGCADLKKERTDYDAPGLGTATTYAEMVRDLWSDQIDENDNASTDEKATDEWVLANYGVDVECLPCLKLPRSAGKPKAEPKPKSQKRDAKRQLATLVVEAAAKMVADLLGGDAVFADEHISLLGELSHEEIRTDVAHWLHHLPADRDRWVAAGLPKPDRSDWR